MGVDGLHGAIRPVGDSAWRSSGRNDCGSHLRPLPKTANETVRIGSMKPRRIRDERGIWGTPIMPSLASEREGTFPSTNPRANARATEQEEEDTEMP